jgi:hypothetical protein
MLQSVAATAADPAAIEVVLVVDADDQASRTFRFEQLHLKHVIVPPGQPMGALNMAGYQAAQGDYLMLLNDDVVARTRAWDRRVLAALRGFPDGIVLAHVNDLLFRQVLCTFPVVSRTYCELAGGICPREYLRYRIDDHIEDVFNLLWVLGERRTIYLGDVVFEHLKFAEHEGRREYHPDSVVLAQDAPRFLALFEERKNLALQLKERIVGPASPSRLRRWRARLDEIADPFTLRVPERHRVETRAQRLHSRLAAGLRRLPGAVCQKGLRGLVQALGKRLGRRAGNFKAGPVGKSRCCTACPPSHPG